MLQTTRLSTFFKAIKLFSHCGFCLCVNKIKVGYKTLVCLSGEGGYFLVKDYWDVLLDGVCIFHNWTDYNGVTFLVELLEWGRKFSGFLG